MTNMGNTYFVKMPSVSAWVLVDSGEDFRGRMTDVAGVVRDKVGRPDVLLSRAHLINA
jgi:hypothetical protein